MPDTPQGLHPDCPDLRRLGPNRAEATLRATAARMRHDEERRSELWSRGFTRRRALAGAGMVGVAAFGAQLVTTRVSFGDPASTGGTLVVVFLRGGMDGLSVLVPADDPHLKQARPNIAVPGGALIPLTRGFGLHPALEPMRKHWKNGTFSAVPALSTPDLSRSHFQAQDCLERGGASTSAAATGWLDRVLAQLGPGTTFRAVGEASTLPRALVGTGGELALRGIDTFKLAGWDGVHDRTVQALSTLYTGFDHPLAGQAKNTLQALATAEKLSHAQYQASVPYPDDDFAKSLADVARLIKSKVGLRVACVDLGGWDMHTNLGKVDAGDMTSMLTRLGKALDAFATDLGPALNDTTLVTMTEFGRRVEENGNTGLDHGHGAVALLLGGGLKAQNIAGDWAGLAPDVLDNGDVPGSNDYRDLLGELVTKRLGLGADGLRTIFPGHDYAALGAMR
ncbi:DUF1501 domain-containing protein [Labedaea rhizosphaerae]|uniref:Uncharacterized protein (DUF1501 family) n=1 Tax=Labedaea rhizosphaerae TaxID=598644 RepID=A0A4R6S534_LABRH|nr:DUF1501 domain-containing protein [Labedaea rhizosphaerae]TDP94810.1 uncharacterized protein (DUF1501 family) [Labedaea rhizosphaerae]